MRIVILARIEVKGIQSQRADRCLIHTCRENQQMILQLICSCQCTILRLGWFDNHKRDLLVVFPKLRQQMVNRICLARPRQAKNCKMLRQVLKRKMVVKARPIPLVHNRSNGNGLLTIAERRNVNTERCAFRNRNTLDILCRHGHRHSKLLCGYRRCRAIEYHAQGMISQSQLVGLQRVRVNRLVIELKVDVVEPPKDGRKRLRHGDCAGWLKRAIHTGKQRRNNT